MHSKPKIPTLSKALAFLDRLQAAPDREAFLRPFTDEQLGILYDRAKVLWKAAVGAEDDPLTDRLDQLLGELGGELLSRSL